MDGRILVGIVTEGLPSVMLAVKASNQKPAQWVTHESKVGDKVEVRVGGTCILQQEFDRPAVFCAGGIGISPLLSMYQQHVQERGAIGKGASFLYLASGEDELVFVDELMGLVSSKQDRLILSLTQQSAWTNQLEGVECVTGRGVMQSFLCNDSPSDALFYVCGPPSMLDDAIDFLEQRGIPSNKVLYEKWW